MMLNFVFLYVKKSLIILNYNVSIIYIIVPACVYVEVRL